MRSQVSRFRVVTLCAIGVLGVDLHAHRAIAATATGNFQVRITIQESCIIVGTPSPLDFGNQNVLAANVDATTTLTVQCTTSTPYNIGLNAGTGAGATIAVRKMTGPGAATVDYSLYQDSPRTVLWGDVIGTNAQAGTGNGSPQAYTVYGRVPPQLTPASGLYTDTITVTVTY
jgi:spore coat protein U-like protein